MKKLTLPVLRRAGVSAAMLLWSCGGPSAPSTNVPGLAAAGAPLAVTSASTARVGPPDIIVILADDMGYGDLGVYGNPVIKTPIIDRLAAEGARFDAMYVPTPICAPSRAALLTGRYGVRNGVLWNSAGSINTTEVTIAKVLRDRGYATGIVGKWHLGAKVAELPLRLGFDFFYGMLNSPPFTDFISGEAVTKDFPGMDQVTKRLTAEATAFIKRTPVDRPLFLEVSEHAPHTPNLTSAEFAQTSRNSFGDAVQELDWSVEQIMATLRETGRDQNALVVFMSDNGPEGLGSPGPFVYGKGNINEGGIRVPAIAWQPGKIPAGRVIKDPTSSLDLFPTLAAMAGAPMPPRDYDGINISSLITGAVDKIPGPGIDGGREFFFFMTNEVAALRSGKWKYVKPGFRDSVPVLYDLDADPGETNNLRRYQINVLNQLEKRISQFR